MKQYHPLQKFKHLRNRFDDLHRVKREIAFEIAAIDEKKRRLLLDIEDLDRRRIPLKEEAAQLVSELSGFEGCQKQCEALAR